MKMICRPQLSKTGLRGMPKFAGELGTLQLSNYTLGKKKTQPKSENYLMSYARLIPELLLCELYALHLQMLTNDMFQQQRSCSLLPWIPTPAD